MIALVAKDLRLAAGALRPMAVVVVGLLLGTLLLGLLPAHSVAFLPSLTVMEVARSVGVALLVAGAVPAAWTTSSILLGDRVHRAGSLAATLPIPRLWRAIAGSTALFVCYLGVVVLSWVVQEERALPALGLGSLSWALGASAVGLYLPRVRSPLLVTMWAALTAMIVAAAAVACGWLGVEYALGRLGVDGTTYMPVGSIGPLLEAAWFSGLVVGCAGAVLVLGISALLPLVCGRRPWNLAIIVLSLVLGISIPGSVAAVRTVLGDINVRIAISLRDIERSMPRMIEAGLVNGLNQFFQLHPSNQEWERQNHNSTFRMTTDEVLRRVIEMDASAVPDSELVQACLARGIEGGREADWLRWGMVNRFDGIAVDWAMAFADRPRNGSVQASDVGNDAYRLLLALLTEEFGVERGGTELSRRVASSRQIAELADELDRYATNGHRHAERIRSVVRELRAWESGAGEATKASLPPTQTGQEESR